VPASLRQRAVFVRPDRGARFTQGVQLSDLFDESLLVAAHDDVHQQLHDLPGDALQEPRYLQG
jgi:hypothetical protein